MINKYLGKSQFYYRNTTRYNQPPNVVPDFVDFEYSFDEELQLITQVRKKDTLDYLELIYKESYTVGYLQEGHDLAENYGSDFVNYINQFNQSQ